MKTAFGATRFVFIFKKVVVKIPNFRFGWNQFLKGLCANMEEKRTWDCHPRKDLLCPVLWASWGGWLVVMLRADMEQGILHFIKYDTWTKAGLGGDDKPDNYGVVNGEIVKVDYGSYYVRNGHVSENLKNKTV